MSAGAEIESGEDDPLTPEEIEFYARRARLRKMSRSLAWQMAFATMLDIFIRGIASGAAGQGTATGTNMLVFAVLAIVVNYSLRPSVGRGDSLPRKAPWLWYFWPLVLGFIVVRVAIMVAEPPVSTADPGIEYRQM